MNTSGDNVAVWKSFLLYGCVLALCFIFAQECNNDEEAPLPRPSYYYEEPLSIDTRALEELQEQQLYETKRLRQEVNRLRREMEYGW